jgi:Cell division protein
MKKILLLCTALCCIFAISSCKSKSSAYKTAYEQAKANDEVWVEEDDDEILTDEEVSFESSVRQEVVKPVSGEDVNGLKRYSVVIGSFINQTNAFSMKDRMVKEGYKPVVAENEKGMLRVIVTSFDNRADAVRSRDAIKSKYEPNFNDAWILERKY